MMGKIGSVFIAFFPRLQETDILLAKAEDGKEVAEVIVDANVEKSFIMRQENFSTGHNNFPVPN